MAFTIGGAVLLVVVMLDILLTMVGANQSSPIAMRVGKAAFDLFKLLPLGAFKHRLMGPAVMTVVASYWVAALALAWSLIFFGSDAAIDFQMEERGSGPLDILAHVGHLLSTVGGGVSRPESTSAALMGVLIGVNGMVVLTLSVSFVLGTTNTVVTGRQLFVSLDIADDANRIGDRAFLDKLIGFLVALNASPMALYFSHEDEEFRIPKRLATLLQMIAEDSPETARTLAGLLPGLKAGPAASLRARLDDWARRYAPAPGLLRGAASPERDGG
ncbi:hypothetical protein [Thalassorhabdomicrobium marinisediminis]|uniref:Uncharacterized protein n=1 Tax=Thalassorhabdomicrobium marinisediminis TaxID=2170577 RepID=A0A2T7FZM9_9RHOB|nr:hypothetical protein [Thalassorhabdomicrobium marinisediminis]PVA07598.1 hypothetical protein DC363_02890 [Thalassorhabdomicrobium marinisediminis]